MSYYEGTEYGEKNGYGKNSNNQTEIKKGSLVDYKYNGKEKKQMLVRSVDKDAGIAHVHWSEFTSIWINIDQLKLSK